MEKSETTARIEADIEMLREQALRKELEALRNGGQTERFRAGKHPLTRHSKQKHVAAKKRPTPSQRVEARYNLTPERVIALLLENRGLLATTAKAIGIRRGTLSNYVHNNEDCLKAMQEARDAMGDLAEGKLFDHVEAGELRALLYYLSTAQRHRGYGMRADESNSSVSTGPLFVDTINVIGVPSGTFLPPEIATRDSVVIEHDSGDDE